VGGLAPLRLANLAALGLILKALFRVEELFTRGEHKFIAALSASEHAIAKFHADRPPFPATLCTEHCCPVEGAETVGNRRRAALSNALVPLDPRLFANALPGQGFLHSSLFAGFQIERVSLNLFNDVFLLNLALETAKCVF
jgi:hypothetical protein